MYNEGSTSFEGCYFYYNSADNRNYPYDDIHNTGSVTGITGFPAGYETTQESYTLDNYDVPGTHKRYSCTKCDAGSGATAGDTSCSTCPIGTSSTGGTPCTPCSAGKYNAATGSTLCTFCEPSKHLSDDSENAAAHDNASDCVKCQAGRYSDAFGFGDYTQCEKGKSRSSTGTTSCDDCGVGKYR